MSQLSHCFQASPTAISGEGPVMFIDAHCDSLFSLLIVCMCVCVCNGVVCIVSESDRERERWKRTQHERNSDRYTRDQLGNRNGTIH